MLEISQSFFDGLVLTREFNSRLPPLFGSHLLEIQKAQTGYLGNNKQAVVRQFSDQIIRQDQSLQLLAFGKFGHFCKLADFVVHKEDVLDVGEGIGDVADGFDAVVCGDQGCQAVQVREVCQFTDLVVADIDAFEEILSYWSATRVAPMFQTAVILQPRRSSCRQLRGLVNWGDCCINSAVILISYNYTKLHSNYEQLEIRSVIPKGQNTFIDLSISEKVSETFMIPALLPIINDYMSVPTRDQYNKLKSQYDQLLERHQNESIKIKQREHLLNEQINKIKTQSQVKEKQLSATIITLQEKIDELNKGKGKQSSLNVQVSSQRNKRIQELESDARKLIDQNIVLTSENSSLKVDNNTLQSKNQEQDIEIEKMRNYINSLQKDLDQFTKNHKNQMSSQELISSQEIKLLQEKYQKSVKSGQNLKQNMKQLKEKLRFSEEQCQKMSERQKRSLNLLKRKDIQISSLQSQINARKIGQSKRKTTQISQNSCQKCHQLQQQIGLLKQMVKSTQGMVRVKQIQNQKFRMHSQELANQSRYSAKQKGTPLPPLKKK